MERTQRLEDKSRKYLWYLVIFAFLVSCKAQYYRQNSMANHFEVVDVNEKYDCFLMYIPAYDPVYKRQLTGRFVLFNNTDFKTDSIYLFKNYKLFPVDENGNIITNAVNDVQCSEWTEHE